MKASSNSFPCVVENAGVAIVVDAVGLSRQINASVPIAPDPPEAWPVNATPLTFAPLTVTPWLEGVKLYPVFDGVIVYPPFASPVNEKLPFASAVVLAAWTPLSCTIAPLPAAAGPILPEILKVAGAFN